MHNQLTGEGLSQASSLLIIAETSHILLPIASLGCPFSPSPTSYQSYSVQLQDPASVPSHFQASSTAQPSPTAPGLFLLPSVPLRRAFNIFIVVLEFLPSSLPFPNPHRPLAGLTPSLSRWSAQALALICIQVALGHCSLT